jgi:hypothetical protein
LALNSSYLITGIFTPAFSIAAFNSLKVLLQDVLSISSPVSELVPTV